MMTKTKLTAATNARIEETKNALQTLWGSINKGQKKQIIKRQEIKEMFDRYGVDYSDA